VKHWKEFKYKNLAYVLLSIVIALWLSQYEPFRQFLLSLHNFGYMSVFLAGLLFVSTFTVSMGIVILFVLAQFYSPLEIGLVAGLGAVLGDLLIFQFVKDRLATELQMYYSVIDGKHTLQKILYTKSFRWLLPVVGAIIVASPLPDELGVGLMGIAKMKTYKFLLVSYVLNAVGIFLIISAVVLVK
jgi:hypothetical protein